VVGSLAVTALDAALLMLALGGIPALVAHRRALALLAVWLGGGLVLSLLRPVRVHDPVATIAESPATIAALFFIPLFVPALSAYGERVGLLPLPGGALLRWGGVFVSGAGLALRIGAMARLGSRFSPLLVTQRDHVLETAGPYAFVRHPGYLGTLLVAIGTVLAFGSAAGFALVVPLTIILDRRSRREEALLEREFGEAFRVWRARTGRLLPRVRSNSGAS
jgi:protein-S-isoprenylcysteine O-methyltransferase Ste14